MSLDEGTYLSLWKGAIPIPVPRVTMLDIAEAVASRYSLSLDSLRYRGRQRRYAHPRQEAIWLMMRERRWSLNQIGRFFGDLNHTTVRYARIAHEARLNNAPRPWKSRKRSTVHTDFSTAGQGGPWEYSGKNRGGTRPTREDVMRRAIEAALNAGVPVEDVLGPSRQRILSHARREAWLNLFDAGHSIIGIAETWGCHRKSIQRALRERRPN